VPAAATASPFSPPSPRVAFQGEEGAYSEEAVRFVFEAPALHPCVTFEDAFVAVEQGAAHRAVIPIENAVFGSVRVNYDHLRTHDVHIVGELQLRIRHHLLAVSGGSIEAVEEVRSHAQALGQCRAWLRENLPGASTRPVADTAGAARDVAERGDASVAAIASVQAAARYGLDVLAAELEDNPQNYTRFLVLAPGGADADPGADDGAGGGNTADNDGAGGGNTAGKGAAGEGPRGEGPVRRYKTSIAFTLRDNVPGALAKSLSVFAIRDLDLFKIESRPLIGRPGRYRFYVDIDGAAGDAAVREAVEHLKRLTSEVQALGSYPQGPVVEGVPPNGRPGRHGGAAG
jgi:prephenate dehydratase